MKRTRASRLSSFASKSDSGRVPQPGRLSLTPMLSDKGKLIGDFTMSCLAEEEFQLTASYGSQNFHF